MRRHVLSLLAFASLTWSLAAHLFPQQTTPSRIRPPLFVCAKAIADSTRGGNSRRGTRVRLYHCSEGVVRCSVQRPPVTRSKNSSRHGPSRKSRLHRTQQGRGYVNVDGQWVPSPTRTADGQPPPGRQRNVATGRSASVGIGRDVLTSWRCGRVALNSCDSDCSPRGAGPRAGMASMTGSTMTATQRRRLVGETVNEAEAKLTHLELVQGVINRMASNSFLLKGWCVTVVSALLALSAKDADSDSHFLPTIRPYVLDSRRLLP